MSENHSPAPKKQLGVLIENLFDASQIRQLLDATDAAGIEVSFLSYLWGHETLEFTGDDPDFHIQVSIDVTQVSPTDFDAILLPSGYAMDRLRYQQYPVCGAPNQAPAIQFLRGAVLAMNVGYIKIAAIGHGLMLMTASPDTLQGRQVTCAHNIIGDVANAGGFVMFNGNQTADLHLDRGLLTARDGSVASAFFEALVTEIKTNCRPAPAL